MNNKQSPDDGMVKILNKLIPYYEEHLAVVKGMEFDDTVINYLYDKNIFNGICICATLTFNISYDQMDWAMKASTNVYWYRRPSRACNMEEIIDRLQFRIDKMKSLLNQATT